MKLAFFDYKDTYMKFPKVLFFASVAFLLGLAIGLWWNLSHATPGTNLTPTNDTDFELNKPVFVTTEIAKLRFSVVRQSRHFLPDATGAMHCHNSVEAAVESTVDPAAPVSAIQVENCQALQSGKAVMAAIHSKVVDKYSVPQGIYSKVNENALILTFTFESQIPVGEPDTTSYALRFTFGPSQVPVELAPLRFP